MWKNWSNKNISYKAKLIKLPIIKITASDLKKTDFLIKKSFLTMVLQTRRLQND